MESLFIESTTFYLKLFVFNLLIYFLFTTQVVRERIYRRIRVIFYLVHKLDYLSAAKKGSSSFLNILNIIFGETKKSDSFFSKAYYNKKMIITTYWISFSYISISIVYLDYIVNETVMSSHLFYDTIKTLPKFLHNMIDISDNNWTHILLVFYILFPILLLMIVSLVITKKINQSWFTSLIVIGIMIFSFRWILTSISSDFDSPIYIPLQFIVHGSGRFESLVGDIYLLFLLAMCIIAFRVWFGTIITMMLYILTSFLKVVNIGLNEGFSSLNFSFWFDRIVSAISRSSILFFAPFFNFLVDFISINVSRYLFHKLSLVITWKGFFLVLLYDIVFAFLAFISTPIIFLFLASIIDFINIWEFGSESLTSLLFQEYLAFITGKIDSRTWWIWLMLISTIFPSVIHILFVFFEMFVKLIEPFVRKTFYKGHYLLIEKDSEEAQVLKIKFSGYNKSIFLLVTIISLLEVIIYYLFIMLFRLN